MNEVTYETTNPNSLIGWNRAMIEELKTILFFACRNKRKYIHYKGWTFGREEVAAFLKER